MSGKQNLIAEKSFDFALQIIDLYRKLNIAQEYVLSKQLLRSGTSIGANIEEALAAHSRKDFLAKMIISHKEARETRYWLMLIEKGKLFNGELTFIIKEANEIINILSAIITTSKKNINEIKNEGSIINS